MLHSVWRERMRDVLYSVGRKRAWVRTEQEIGTGTRQFHTRPCFFTLQTSHLANKSAGLMPWDATALRKRANTSLGTESAAAGAAGT